jgi:hypothetical protein
MFLYQGAILGILPDQKNTSIALVGMTEILKFKKTKIEKHKIAMCGIKGV